MAAEFEPCPTCGGTHAPGSCPFAKAVQQTVGHQQGSSGGVTTSCSSSSHRRTVLYRFADSSEYGIEITTEETSSGLEHSRIAWKSSSGLSVLRAMYFLRSSTRQLISARTYLSLSLGVDGQYTGFFEYYGAEMEPYLLNATPLSEAKRIFGTGRKCVFLFLESIAAFSWGDPNIRCTLTEAANVSLDSTIEPVPETLLHMQLGYLMDETHRNSAEHNFVGDAAIECFLIDTEDLVFTRDVLEDARKGMFPPP